MYKSSPQVHPSCEWFPMQNIDLYYNETTPSDTLIVWYNPSLCHCDFRPKPKESKENLMARYNDNPFCSSLLQSRTSSRRMLTDCPN